MGILDPKINKYQDAELAETLWAEYLLHGTVDAVNRYCVAEGIEMSKPTLRKMSDHFDWPGERAKATQKTFAGNIDHEGDLAAMNADLVGLKNEIAKGLKTSPLDKQLHNIYGDYIGRILDIRRIMIAAKQVDRDSLLIDALKAIVDWLLSHGEKQAAELIGDNLEVIEREVRDKWQAK